MAKRIRPAFVTVRSKLTADGGPNPIRLAEDRNEAAKVETGVARITGPDKEGANLTRVRCQGQTGRFLSMHSLKI